MLRGKAASERSCLIQPKRTTYMRDVAGQSSVVPGVLKKMKFKQKKLKKQSNGSTMIHS